MTTPETTGDPMSEGPKGHDRHSVVLAVLVGALTALAFLPTLQNGFVEWDDNVNLYDNPNYRGLGWRQIHWMVTTGLMGHYIPVTWFTFGLDFTLWGMNPSGYHLTSLLLHAANAALFLLIAYRLLRCCESFDVRA